MYGLTNYSYSFSDGSKSGTGSDPISISPLFSRGTQPKLTKIECSLAGLIVELESLSYLILAVTNGAKTKYPSFSPLCLLMKNLSSLKYPFILTSLYSQFLIVGSLSHG